MRRMPAEWEKHDATWIAWPHREDDWHDKFAAIEWVYAEIVRGMALGERVEIICLDEGARKRAQFCIEMHGVQSDRYRFHILKTDRSWLRDSAPTAIFEGSEKAWVTWTFNAWAKYDDYHLDAGVPALVGKISGYKTIPALRPDNGEPMILEGGAIETDGQGTMIVTEECLLSEIQCRNPGLTREGYEKAFREYLGITSTIWLIAGCDGDDTHGHIDDVARFYAPGKVLLAFEENPAEHFHGISKQNEEILKKARDAKGSQIEVTRLPMPRNMSFGPERLPASYANFYITNSTVLVPTFNDVNDAKALGIIQRAFPGHTVIGIAATDLVLGFGTLHCLSQQQPA